MAARYDDLGIDPEILGPEKGREERVGARLFKVARKAARQIPFMEDVIAAYYCAVDPATPVRVRGTIFAGLAYFVMPFDIIPDAILGIGFTDDASILLGVLALIGSHMREEHREAARAALGKADTEDDNSQASSRA
ncbi:YkvA family protein [Stappia sp. WLB 29]|uniref:YkvA family protein n=1 Tax=Stappia sp. WLB 29 TaxID=2925220 RepID=UPI0020BFA8F2|nr:YkvA family protein [Stappia sp. WLB 29]